MPTTARLYHCARCHCQVVICRHCDRGNLYCAKRCAQSARVESQRRATSKYQSSRGGRIANAARQQRYRERERQKVTQQGSPPPKANDLLHLALNIDHHLNPTQSNRLKEAIYCHFCGRECDLFLRLNFIRSPSRYRGPR